MYRKQLSVAHKCENNEKNLKDTSISFSPHPTGILRKTNRVADRDLKNVSRSAIGQFVP